MSWNKYEAALLLDTHRRIKSGLAVKKDAVRELSLRLREGMSKCGLIISDTFRNENGIALQLSAMEYCLTDGTSGIHSVSKVFSEIAHLYQTAPDTYSAILDAAQKVYPTVAINNGGIAEASFNEIVSSETNNLSENTHSWSLFEDEPQEDPAQEVVAEPSRRYVSVKVKNVLITNFKSGFRLESAIDVRKFRRAYQNLNGESYLNTDAQLCEEVQSCGIVYEGKVYIPELMLDKDLKKELISSIQSRFDAGEKCVYYSVLFEEYNERFLDHQIYSEKMMKEYLEYFKGSSWHFNRSFISKYANVVVDVESEVINHVKTNGGVISEETIFSELHMLPQDTIKMVIIRNSNILISTGRTGQRFHIDNFQITGEEKLIIGNCIQEAIDKYKYITTTELLKDIRVNAPNVLDYNEVFGEIGIRNALSVVYSGQFNFSGNIISSRFDIWATKRSV